MALLNTRIQILLIVVLAYLLILGLGLQARLDFDPPALCTNRRARECNVFIIGRAMLHRVNCLPDQILRRVRWATIEAA